MENIAKIIFSNSNNTPDKIAIWHNQESINYRDFSELASKYARYMASKCKGKSSLVGVPLHNSINGAAIMVAAAATGVCLLPVNPTMPKAKQKAIFDSMRVDCVVDNTEEEINTIKNLSGEHYIDETLTGKEAFVLALTSGEFAPKYIELTHNDKFKRIKANAELFDVNSSDVILSATPFYHSLAFRMVLMSLMYGGTVVVMDQFSPNRWLDNIEDHSVTFSISVASQLAQIEHLLTSPYCPDISSLRCLVSSSAPIEPHVRSGLIRRLDCDFCEIYGTSECSTVTKINYKNEIEKRSSVGRPINQAIIKIVSRTDKESSLIEEVGEIAVKTDLIFKGYFGQYEQTQASFTEDGYFLTGDLGMLDEEGYLYYYGRRDELFKVDGINVYPREIEQILDGMAGIEENVSFMYPDNRYGEIPAIALVRERNSGISEEDVKKYCEENLSVEQRPLRICFVDKLPKNKMGKIVRNNVVDVAMQFNKEG